MRKKNCGVFFTAFIVAFLLAGCAATISSVRDKPIKQSPGEVSLGTSINDTKLETLAEVNIKKASKLLDDSHVVCVVFNGDLLLTGQVPNEQEKQLAETVVQKLQGIKKIYNQLSIKTNTSALVRASDAWLTTKIKAKIFTTKNVPDSHIKIVTEDSIVFLMGTVTNAVAEQAISAARNTDGVKKVTVLFNYLD